MAKESKQDRIVRSVLDQATEHLHELKALEANPAVKELDVERWAQSFLKNCLGFSSMSGYSIRAQETKGKMRPDLIVVKNDKPVFVVEVKKFGFDLNKSDFRSGKVQLKEYLNLIGDVKWGILTNGCEWKLFDFAHPQYGGIEISAFDLRADDDTIEVSKRIVEEQCYEMIDLHESSFSADAWPELSKEAMAFSPESLSRAILTNDVIKLIAKTIRGEHEYRANVEVLTDKIYQLLEKGLDDSIPEWNEAKQVEFQKFIKAQKRASRRSQRSRKSSSTPAASQPVVEANALASTNVAMAVSESTDKKPA